MRGNRQEDIERAVIRWMSYGARMMEARRSGITGYLIQWSEGDAAAFAALVPLVEHELRQLARHCLRRERNHHTLQATALVNEAWIRLASERGMQWHDRGHFLAVSAQLMRFILVDYARRHHATKRGGDLCRVSLSEALDVADTRLTSLIDVDAALARLERLDKRKARVATLRLFAGTSIEETARALGVSGVTVTRDWRFARAWLHRELHGGDAAPLRRTPH
jgi:RNA polymerase sigma-70 factor, ECF subfamily